MSIENNFIKHIVATKERINEWPEWKKNLLGGDDLSSKSIKVLDNLAIQQDKKNKK
ncbi:hypothetical protein [Klebsiella grimontii]|uniref:hypothetical protein n=1 Tax=Klebsiella grimontii TaxID=2058152 RepID=UPI000AB57860|nr:hypothetical protein [Klebsiella grimontii]MDH0812960.1 hypothetical protein [Klebsiella grimontii]MDH2041907.1 hypothetical protein [Klebsiella grimontii]GJK90880.1 hypothetical protein TUM17568_20860 [Klebsiella oxytoca]GJK99968.1 hypothetical protein TUM17569_54290 [Klebsiella oxytoca]